MTPLTNSIPPSSADFVPYDVEVVDQNTLDLPLGTVLRAQGALASMLKFEHPSTHATTYIRRALVRSLASADSRPRTECSAHLARYFESSPRYTPEAARLSLEDSLTRP